MKNYGNIVGINDIGEDTEEEYGIKNVNQIPEELLLDVDRFKQKFVGAIANETEDNQLKVGLTTNSYK